MGEEGTTELTNNNHYIRRSHEQGNYELTPHHDTFVGKPLVEHDTEGPVETDDPSENEEA